MPREMNNHLAAASSKARPGAPRKARKRKKKQERELSDPEVTVPQKVHLRGRARGRNNTTIITNERGKLNSATFLRYFMHIWDSFPKEKLEPFTYFDPLWFELYSHEKNREMILNCIKEKGVFSKKYVFVPIVMWSHWSLLIFFNLDKALARSKTDSPCMLLLDSLHAIGPKRLEPLIRRLLFDMYSSEERPETRKQLKKMPLLIPKVPQQEKGEDCGFYVLYFIKLFLESPPENFSSSEDCPYFMKKDWFSVEDVESFCKSLDAFSMAESDTDKSASDDSSDCVQFIGCSSLNGM